MKLHAALTLVLVAPAAIALAGSGAPAYAVATCQGRPATIEGASGSISGTEGDDVIVSTGPDTRVSGLGGNDLICVVGGEVVTGPGDDSVLSTAPAGVSTQPFLNLGNDTYVSGAGGSYVYVDEVTSVHITMGPGGGTVELHPTSTAGTGTVDFGDGPAYLYAFGARESRVDLAHQTARVDGLLTVTTVGLRSATATGCRVRMHGDDGRNVLNAFGSDVVVSGGAGRDTLSRVGNGFDLDLPRCRVYRSVFRGQDGPDRMTGRAGDDRLLGGRGHDVAQGAGGVDTCRAEVRRNCER